MYRRPRIIAALTMRHMDLVKTVGFRNPRYIGDPVNSVRIFNNKDVDEMCMIDITATKESREPDIEFLHGIASEAFMPLGYGGGIRTVEQAKNIFRIGYEKVILNSLLFDNPDEVKRIVEFAGSQSVVASIDYKRELFGKTSVVIHGGLNRIKKNVIEAIRYAEGLGVGEVFLTSVDYEGKMEGYDINMMESLKDKAAVPVILNGGAGTIGDMKAALEAGADAVAVSSFFLYYGENKAVLIHTPEEEAYYRMGIYEE